MARLVVLAAAALIPSCSAPPDRLPSLVSLSEDCSTAHITVKTEPEGEVRVRGVQQRAGTNGIAVIDVPRTSLLFESGLPYTFDLEFGAGLGRRFTARMKPSPRIAVREGGAAPNSLPVLTAWIRDSCGGSAALGNVSPVLKYDGTFEVTLQAWQVESGSSAHGSVSLNPTVRRYSEPGDTLGLVLQRFHAVRETPVPDAPPFDPEASVHPTLLFEGGDYLRAAALGERTLAEVEAIAFYSLGDRDSIRCARPAGASRSRDDTSMEIVRIEGLMEVVEARTGKLLVRKTFRQGECPRGRYDYQKVIRTNPERLAFEWLAMWAGSRLEQFGNSKGVP